MIFGKEATFVLNILPAKIQKVKPETKKKRRNNILDECINASISSKSFQQFSVESCELWSLDKKASHEGGAPGKAVKQSSTPLQMIRRKEATERGIKIWGGWQPSMKILRCFGHFLVFHAKTAWVHVGFMK